MLKNPSIEELVRWAGYLCRMSRTPRVIKLNRNRTPHQGEQECARRRAQMAKHGKNYWIPDLEDGPR